jgi:CheY-like chemotaxis protein
MPHKLLLADDSVTIQRVIELTFADEDITVIAVGDGRQAIERVQSERPDIVLADVGMPERDGYEVAAFIKGTPELAHIPVLLLTGAFEPIDEGRVHAAGCDGVLVKPFEPQMVISRVKDLIAGRRPVVKMAGAAAQPAPFGDAVRADPAAGPGNTPVVGPQSPSGPVEDYFDRLDAAFASLDGAPGAPPAPGPAHARHQQTPPVPPRNAGLAEELANWDPNLESANQSGEAASAASPGPGVSARTHDTAPAATSDAVQPPSSPAHPPTLAEAFAALLAAEQGRAFTPAAVGRGATADDLVEQVTRRVIERLGDAAVRDVVVDVAERLVLEEIARIKANTQ